MCFQAEDGLRYLVRSRGLGDVYKRQRHLHPSQAVKSLPMLAGYSLIQNGDVHRLDEFLGALQLRLELPTISEIRKAFHNQDGRQFSILNVPN